MRPLAFQNVYRVVHSLENKKIFLRLSLFPNHKGGECLSAVIFLSRGHKSQHQKENGSVFLGGSFPSAVGLSTKRRRRRRKGGGGRREEGGGDLAEERGREHGPKKKRKEEEEGHKREEGDRRKESVGAKEGEA